MKNVRIFITVENLRWINRNIEFLYLKSIYKEMDDTNRWTSYRTVSENVYKDILFVFGSQYVESKSNK